MRCVASPLAIGLAGLCLCHGGAQADQVTWDCQMAPDGRSWQCYKDGQLVPDPASADTGEPTDIGGPEAAGAPPPSTTPPAPVATPPAEEPPVDVEPQPEQAATTPPPPVAQEPLARPAPAPAPSPPPDAAPPPAAGEEALRAFDDAPMPDLLGTVETPPAEDAVPATHSAAEPRPGAPVQPPLVPIVFNDR